MSKKDHSYIDNLLLGTSIIVCLYAVYHSFHSLGHLTTALVALIRSNRIQIFNLSSCDGLWLVQLSTHQKVPDNLEVTRTFKSIRNQLIVHLGDIRTLGATFSIERGIMQSAWRSK